jgi:hypothetical protein
MSDRSTPKAVVERAYELISFGPGGEPGWATFRALFTEPAVLALRVFPGDLEITVMDLDTYEAVQVTASMKAEGYDEKPVHATYRETGDICEARVRFQMVFGPDRIHDALDVFQLVRCGGEWRIASIVSEILEPGATA